MIDLKVQTCSQHQPERMADQRDAIRKCVFFFQFEMLLKPNFPGGQQLCPSTSDEAVAMELPAEAARQGTPD